MRAFVSGVCCVIVGLEVLIGVPLVVCLVFFGLTQTYSPLAFEVHSDPSAPPTIAPPNYSTPPSPTYSQLVPGDLPPSATSASLPPLPMRPVRPECAESAIMEAREVIGSPLAGTVLDSQEARADAPSDWVQTLRQVAADEVPAQPLEAAAKPRPKSNTTEEPADAPVPAAPLGATDELDDLHHAAQHLYQIANRHEEEGEFERADQLRELARDIRNEIFRLRRHRAEQAEPPHTTQSVPFSELGASF